MNQNVLDIWKEIMRHRPELPPDKAAEIAVEIAKKLSA